MQDIIFRAIGGSTFKLLLVLLLLMFGYDAERAWLLNWLIDALI